MAVAIPSDLIVDVMRNADPARMSSATAKLQSMRDGEAISQDFAGLLGRVAGHESGSGVAIGSAASELPSGLPVSSAHDSSRLRSQPGRPHREAGWPHSQRPLAQRRAQQVHSRSQHGRSGVASHTQWLGTLHHQPAAGARPPDSTRTRQCRGTCGALVGGRPCGGLCRASCHRAGQPRRRRAPRLRLGQRRHARAAAGPSRVGRRAGTERRQ